MHFSLNKKKISKKNKEHLKYLSVSSGRSFSGIFRTDKKKTFISKPCEIGATSFLFEK
jgi:hypothetical protein